MSASQFASFAAYTPPPDEHARIVTTSVPQRQSRLGSAWFPEQDSYQSGGIPTFGSHYSNELPTQDVTTNQWQTRYGWRIDILAAAAYVLGPLSETENDYVRFHAYQSALLTTPAILCRLFVSLFQSLSWLAGALTFIILAFQLLLAFLAYRGASGNSLTSYHAPLVGRIAEDWVAEE
ncbi:hypothetical protein CVT26_002108 [Gymnopilus dilepis]|uniref:Uncharacterized protein n=1 Tax=Gymnopilus dilepis TaxID=231916 RepID=A0A409VBM3_9AGAR|nr:hypothetical protein CVT26_002108 [Gymnopilus dilepis]